ncbi:MAG: hypothetical protein ACPL1B_10345 [Thermoprotei archaeon]
MKICEYANNLFYMYSLNKTMNKYTVFDIIASLPLPPAIYIHFGD